MRKSKWGDKRLLKKEHHKKESLCRRLSLLLSLCVVISLLGGVVSFPALARENEHTEPKEEAREGTLPLKEEDMAVEVSVTDPDFNRPDDEGRTWMNQATPARRRNGTA